MSYELALALGDALAVALIKKKGFSAEDFALVHPSGSLGRKLLLRVSDVWHHGEELPIVKLDSSMKDLLYIMSSKGFGCAGVTDNSGRLIGIVTDGDLRRGMEKHKDFSLLSIENLMSHNPKRIESNALAAEAMVAMEKYSITSLFSVDSDEKPIGIVHLHDLLKAGLR